jgi:hypothetical protein
MKKFAAPEIADYVLFKVAMDEALEKCAFRGAGGNWPHVWKRLAERISAGDKSLVKKVIESTATRLNKAPMQSWYKPVYDNRTKKLTGYIVGQGRYISSVYSPTMTPRGTKWG